MIDAVVRERFADLAALAHRLNEDPAARCLHTHGDPTPETLLANMRELDAADGLVLAVERDANGRPTGFAGADVAPAIGRAWLWGPLVDARDDADRAARAGALLDGPADETTGGDQAHLRLLRRAQRRPDRPVRKPGRDLRHGVPRLHG